MIACSGKNLSKMYGGDPVLEGVTFEVSEHDRIGIVGRNGSGKTTLLKIISGQEHPDSGNIHWKKGTTVGYLEQLPRFPKEVKTVDVLKTAYEKLIMIENEMEEIEQKISRESNPDELTKLVELYGEKQEQFSNGHGYEIEANIERIASGLNITTFLQKPFDGLSGGEKTKVGLGVLLLKKPDLLLLDEPTNHLDIRAVEWLGKFIRDFPGTVLLISHDRYFLDEVVNKIFDLEDGELTSYHMNYSNFIKEKERLLLNEFQKYEEQQKKIKKMRETIKRLKDWANRANPPNEGLHKRARNMERALERMEKIERPLLNRKKMNIELKAASRSGTDAIVVDNVSKTFGQRNLFSHVNMHIRHQDRAVLIGDNGSGKSTFLKMLLNEEEVTEGTIKLGSQVKVGYLAQHVYSSEDTNKSILEAFRDEVNVSEADARPILAKFLFFGAAVFKKLHQLSGGERMRLRLAQLMYQDINLLILDEPTNHLDIDSREVLEEALEEYNGTILAVSHDRYFINKLFQQVFWLADKTLNFFNGNYDYAKMKMNEGKEERSDQQHSKRKSNPKEKVATVEKISERSISSIENDVSNIENAIHQIEEQMMVEGNVDHLQQLQKEKELRELEREELYQCLESLLEDEQ
ncbi:ribosomal protection-like ABC-F family protein [Evansella halocellulosilytica]|uniref:ribosomal protection-like ABC-F family protein n=1 Tax=Evansella halocellulosilytica TaxID=2011013 RepID=UPI000BB8D06C|nr:ABC-F type ribosomal protection protein [Evansella halocellulosilytica]